MSRQVLTLPDIPAAFLTQSEGDLAYAPIVHDHDGTYSPVTHDHAGVYAPTVHDHDARYYTESEADARYSPTAHNHDGTYSPTAHNHDAAYVNVSGDTMSAAAPLLSLNRTEAATYLLHQFLQRQGTNKWGFGLFPDDSFAIYTGDTNYAPVRISPTSRRLFAESGLEFPAGTGVFFPASTQILSDASGNLQYGAGAAHMWSVGGTTLYFVGGNIYSPTNRSINLGLAGNRFNDFYCWHTLAEAQVTTPTLTAPAGQSLYVSSPASIVVNPANALFHPVNETVWLGHNTVRWAYLWAINVKSDYCQAGGDAGQYIQMNYHQINKGGGDHIQIGGTQYFEPAADNYCRIGGPANRWTVVYAANGGIQTSHVSGKYDLAALDPAACATAVLETDWLSFVYLAPVKIVNFPGETPEQNAQREADHARMVEESLLYRKQNGYALGSEHHKVHDLFGLSDRRSVSTQSDLAVVACALQDALRRLAALEGQRT